MASNKLYRSRKDKVIAGVCGGIGEHFGIDPVWARLIMILLLFADGIGLLIYIILWVLIPENPHQRGKKNELEKTVEKTAKKAAKEIKKTDKKNISIVGIVLIGIGAIILFDRIGLQISHILWPVALVVLGLFLIARGK